MQRRPTLLNSCADAATAREAAYRIDRPIDLHRRTSVVALDPVAATVVFDAADGAWSGARFFAADAGTDPSPTGGFHSDGGAPAGVTEVLEDADLLVMVATGAEGEEAAAALADGCRQRRVMTAGLLIGPASGRAAVVATLRPHAAMLMVSRDEDDLADVLTALRA